MQQKLRHDVATATSGRNFRYVPAYHQSKPQLIKHQIHQCLDALTFSVYLTHPQTFSQNSLHLSEEKRIFAED